MKPDTEVLELTVLEGDEEIRSKFDLETDEKLIKLVKLRFADGIPVVYVVTYFPQNLVPDFEKFDFKKNSYCEYLKKIGKKVSWVSRTFEVKIEVVFLS
ncbi:MAG: UTRA domain-containing protein [Fusobacteriaceae bacterium]